MTSERSGVKKRGDVGVDEPVKNMSRCFFSSAQVV